jgi:hypothetical protein
MDDRPDVLSARQKEKTQRVVLAYAKFLWQHGMNRQAFKQYLPLCEPPHASTEAQFRVGHTFLYPLRGECPRDKWRGVELLARAFEGGCLEAGHVLGGRFIRLGDVDKGLEFLERAFRSGYFPSLDLYVRTTRKIGGLRRDPKAQFLLLLNMRQKLERGVSLRFRDTLKSTELNLNLARCKDLMHDKYFTQVQWKYALKLCKMKLRRREAVEWIRVAAEHGHKKALKALKKPDLNHKGHTPVCPFTSGTFQICFDPSKDDERKCWLCNKTRNIPMWKCECHMIICPLCTGGLGRVIESSQDPSDL